ncbi:Ig-like domain-containing protein [Algibacillus agarilyticus]|uniref:Ig-like domain-containing protein n=1 Tax=Algibacillus agarilyticus TaxID=2234133 RepID=UPI000DCFF6C8|nr:Ig-like domain-containing protein [Algibacillus agarilyticus]
MYKTKRTLLSIGVAISLASASTHALAENVVIEVENYDNVGGTFNDNQPNPVTIYSVNGKQGINFVNAGDYVDYNINVVGGEYSVEYLVGTSMQSGAAIELLINDNGNWVSQGTVAVPFGSWDDFQPLSPANTIMLPSGASTIRLLATGSDWQWNMESFSLTAISVPDPDPEPETPVDDVVVNLENFTTTGKTGAAVGGDSIVGFGPTNEGINFNTSGDYADYSVTFTDAGTYNLKLAAGSPMSGQIGAEVLLNGSVVASSELSATAGWDNFEDFDLDGDVVIPSAGTYTFRLRSFGSTAWQWNADTLTFVHSSTDNGNGSDVAVTGVMVNPASASLNIGQSQNITATVTPANATNKAVTFESLDTSIATVNANGMVTAVSNGQAIIRVTTADGFYVATSNINVLADGVAVTGVSVNPTNTTLTVGQSQTVTATISPIDASNNNVSFSSSNTSVASVNANGVITAVNAGQATITVTTEDGSFTAQTNVTVTPDSVAVTGVSITPASTTLVVGQSQNATATVAPSNASNTNVAFSSSNTSVATVNANGVITAVNAGQAMITVTTSDGNFTAQTNVTVNPGGGGTDPEPGEGEFVHNGNGLLWGRVDGATNFAGNAGYTADSPNYKVTTDLLETDDAIDPNSTEVFRGQIYDADGHISFYENIDDSVRLYIDGNLVLSNDSWENSSQTADLQLSPGTHDFELRLGNADGGSGAVSGIGFGIDTDGGTNFVHPSTLSQNIFTSSGLVVVDPKLPPDCELLIQLEDFDATGTTGRVASDPNDGFVVGDTGTNVGWVTNGDYGDYNNVYLEAGTYRSFISVTTPETGSFGARIDINGETASWGYFDSTGGWSIAARNELYGGEFVIETAGNHNLRVEAVGGSDWQWSGDYVCLAKVSDNTARTPAIYDPADHFVAEVNGPSTGLQYLKAPVSIPAANKLLKSDVWYTYPQNRDFYDEDNGGQPGDYADFGATGSFWGHPPESEFYDETVIMDWAVNIVDKYQSEGLEYTARGEFDWGYGWFTEYTTSPQSHYVQTLDDRNVRMTFMGYLSHNGHNNNWLSNHSPAFVPFMKSQVDQLLKANPDKLMFDTQTNSTRATDMRTFGGDFSPYAMQNFRIWLDKKYSSNELAAMGINNINTFDYKQHLLDAGVTHTSFSNGADRVEGNIPMLEDFLYFNRDVWNQKFAEVLSYIRQTHPNIEIGASTQLFESRGYIFNENITFLSGELNLGAKTSISELPTNILVHLKGAQAIDKPLAYAPYPWEFEELRVQDAPRFGRGWVAQAYAYGGLFSIPANVWVGGDVWTWSPGADNYRDIYQFVRAQENLLDDYTSYAKVGLVHAMYSSMKAGFIDGGNQVQSSVKLLTEDNINFDMLVFGDAGYPVVPRDEDFDNFDHIFYDGDLNYLTTEQKAVLDAQGSKVRHIGQRLTIADLAITVSINGTASNDIVSAVSRIHETNASAPYVVHLVNRPFAGGVTPTLNGVEVAIPASYFPQGVTSAKLHLPNGTSTDLDLTTNANGDVIVPVNNLEVWGILELGH